MAPSMKRSCFIHVTSVMWWLVALQHVIAQVYIVRLEGPSGWERNSVAGRAASSFPSSREATDVYSVELEAHHDELLRTAFQPSSYKKLYSYSYLLNGFAVQASPDQADVLRTLAGVTWVEEDWKLEPMTTHTPDFLGLPYGTWAMEGGPSSAGEDVVIGIVDTGIDPTHPSFSGSGSAPYPPLNGFVGGCEESTNSSGAFCNGKIVAARHFSEAAQAAGAFNSSTDFASPLDGDGHGCHTASIAAGNHGVPVLFSGLYFGDASGMAPQARLSIYKALYRQFGGFVSDVVAAIEQAAKDGVDVLNLSVGPSSPPSSSQTTFLNAFDVALLSAVKVGVFVVQAAGNGGPYPRTLASFSPWIMSVAAGLDDRNYSNWVFLGNGAKFMGLGLAPGTPGDQFYSLILAEDAAMNTTVGGFNKNLETC